MVAEDIYKMLEGFDKMTIKERRAGYASIAKVTGFSEATIRSYYYRWNDYIRDNPLVWEDDNLEQPQKQKFVDYIIGEARKEQLEKNAENIIRAVKEQHEGVNYHK